MELNIAEPSKSIVPSRAPASRKSSQKGGWRKRRRQEVIQRARVQKKLRPSLRAWQKSKALDQQADEFVSGIENGGSDVQGSKLDTEQVRHKNSVGAQESNSHVAVGRSFPNQETAKDAIAVKRKVRADANKRNPIDDKLDQKPEAVSAALAVISDIGVSLTETEANVETVTLASTKDSEDVPRSQREGEGKNETFGASTFETTGLYRSIALHLVNRMGLDMPTKIQEEVLKVMLNLEPGQHAIDVVVRSATGSGKTLAYLLPIAHYLLNRTRRVTREDGAIAVIVVPTRELADQVEEVAENVFRPWHWIVVGSVRGGESKKREKARLRKGINVLVATPGRLLDHMRNTRSFSYGFCEFLVLDEADRLLDLGFEGEIKETIENLDNQAKNANPTGVKRRSNILLSATLRNDVEKLAEFSLTNPIEISTSQPDNTGKDSFSMPLQLRQHYCIVEQRYRLVTLACFLRLRALKGIPKRKTQDRDGDSIDGPPCKIIVFFSTCDSVDFHFDLLKKATVPKELHKNPTEEALKEKLLPLSVFRIHGNHTQQDRVQSLRGFRRTSRAVLFCTDVAARGLDLKGLTFAIQYDPPTGGQGEELEYLHRAGRTARIGAQGDALLFLLPSERAYIGKLESKGVSIADISGSAAIAALYPKVDLSSQGSISYGTRLVTSALQESFENRVKDNTELQALAVSGFQAYCRAYATHAKEVRYFFHVRNLHLGHVARAFVLGDKPAELSKLISEMKDNKKEDNRKDIKMRQTKGDIARAIAEGERQPYNDQTTTLARRRREKGRGQEAFKEMAAEFGS